MPAGCPAGVGSEGSRRAHGRLPAGHVLPARPPVALMWLLRLLHGSPAGTRAARGAAAASTCWAAAPASRRCTRWARCRWAAPNACVPAAQRGRQPHLACWLRSVAPAGHAARHGGPVRLHPAVPAVCQQDRGRHPAEGAPAGGLRGGGGPCMHLRGPSRPAAAAATNALCASLEEGRSTASQAGLQWQRTFLRLHSDPEHPKLTISVRQPRASAASNALPALRPRACSGTGTSCGCGTPWTRARATTGTTASAMSPRSWCRWAGASCAALLDRRLRTRRHGHPGSA